MWFSGAIESVRTRQISGNRSKACNMKKWAECVMDDLKEWALTEELTQDRNLWRSFVRNCRRVPTLNRSTPPCAAQDNSGMCTRSSKKQKQI